MSDIELLRLSTFLAQLRQDGYATPLYRVVADYCRDGSIPAVQRNHLWHVRRSDRPRIIRTLGLTKSAPSKSARKETVAA